MDKFKPDFSAVAEQLSKLVPETFGDEVKSMLSSQFEQKLEQLGLVTREEFAIQQKVLLKTREKLDALAIQVSALEQSASAELNHNSDSNTE